MKARGPDPAGTPEAGEKEPEREESRSDFDALLRADTRAGAQRTRPLQSGFAAPRDRSTEGTPARIGHIASLDTDGTVSVSIAGWANAVAARLATPLTADRIHAAIASGQPVVLVFEEGDPLRPIIVGLIESQADIAQAAAPAPATEPAIIEADVDGRRVRITAQDEIVFECGQASVTLRRNGRIIIRGTDVESYSEGTNRIRGGQVRIN